MILNVEVLVTESCTHASEAIQKTKDVLAALALDVTPTLRIVWTEAEASTLAFPGSPTILVNGEDLELKGTHGRLPTLDCRKYGSEDVPPTWLIEAAILRSLSPNHFLFLCVANSARSQMAEGIARSLAPEGVRVSSAGSEPTQIRPEAVKVLREMGIDASVQHSKGMADIEGEVDAVITLCAEEVCPAWLGKAWRIHWGLPDPAGLHGSDEERLEAFREVRDELRRRLAVLFGSDPTDV